MQWKSVVTKTVWLQHYSTYRFETMKGHANDERMYLFIYLFIL